MELPDFDELYRVIGDIKTKTAEQGILKVELKNAESKISKRSVEDESLFVNDKPPSATFVKTTYLHTGIDGELIDKRFKYEQLEAEIEELKNILDLRKSQIEVWRTEQANLRGVGLE